MTALRADARRRLPPILLAQGVGLACGLAGVRLTSQLVSPADYGVYGVCTTMATVGVAVVYAGLVKFVSRHWQGATDRPGLAREVLLSAARKTPWLLAATFVAAWVVAPTRPVIVGACLFAAALLLALAQFAQSALQAAREHWRDLGVSAGMSITRSFLPPILYATTGAGLLALLGGFVLHAATGALLAAGQTARWRRPTAPRSEGRQLTAVYDGPRFVVLAIAAWVLLGVNRWIAAGFFGAETAGYFVLASSLGAILPTMLGMACLQFVQPVWFARPADGDPRALLRAVDRVAAGYTLLAVATAAAIEAAMPWLIGPLVGARYAAATDFVFAAGCAATATTTGLFFHALLLAAHRERDCFAADLAGAVVLAGGGLASAAAGVGAFKLWLMLSPLAPWLVNRTLARRAVGRG